MTIAALDQDWLEKAVEQGQVALPVTKTSDDSRESVLTADTASLQEFVVEHAGDDEAFQPSTVMRRLK